VPVVPALPNVAVVTADPTVPEVPPVFAAVVEAEAVNDAVVVAPVVFAFAVAFNVMADDAAVVDVTADAGG
jgi:hypothetical protein